MADDKHECKLCGKVIDKGVKTLGKWQFHADCYQKAANRLAAFIEILTLPEAEFKSQWAIEQLSDADSSGQDEAE